MSEVIRVLVADDDPDDTYFIRRLIKRTGVKNPVKVFDDGTEVVNYLGARAAAASQHRHTRCCSSWICAWRDWVVSGFWSGRARRSRSCRSQLSSSPIRMSRRTSRARRNWAPTAIS